MGLQLILKKAVMRRMKMTRFLKSAVWFAVVVQDGFAFLSRGETGIAPMSVYSLRVAGATCMWCVFCYYIRTDQHMTNRCNSYSSVMTHYLL